MSAPTRYAVRFNLVDPTRLVRTGSVEQSTVMTVTGLVQGKSSDLDHLNPTEGSRLINRNLARMAHLAAPSGAIIAAANELGAGTVVCHYCSRCGRKFRTNDLCQRCNISFRLGESELGLTAGRAPGIPARVVAYARAQGHVFVYEPPRA